jgi:hypothetical protein
MQFGVAIGIIGMVMATAGYAAEKLPPLPASIPQAWLSAQDSPRVFCTPQRLKTIVASLEQTPWRKAYVAAQQTAADPLINLSDDQLRALVPPPGSLFIYGLGMNLDPVHHQKMRWGGWTHPHVMYDAQNVAYPNARWNDTGKGVADPKTDKKFYFVAQANGQITKNLNSTILPAMADVWALTGSKKHAHAAAVLLDAIAAVYPTNRRGPMDYPTARGDEDRGGRLDRPYYQTARGMMDYAFAIDLIADSGELDQPSAYDKGHTIRENIIRNLLWNGGTYCLDFALKGHALHNGQADYEQGAAVVGALLGVPDFARPMIDGPTSFEHMLANNIGPGGFYVESSTMYANWTRQLYVHSAELLTAMRRLGWKNVPDPHANPALVRFLGPEFNRLELSGHVPMTGDAGPDRAVVDPMRRFPSPPRVYNDVFLDGQITGAWLRLIRGAQTDAAAQLLRDTYGNQPIVPPASPWYERWYVYNLTPQAVEEVKSWHGLPARVSTASTQATGRKPVPRSNIFQTGSAFYGAKGLALLRGGKGEKRHGIQLQFGAMHNHGQAEALTWTFFARGADWSLDPGYFNTHFRFGWTEQTVAHQAMVVDQTSVNAGRGSGALLAWHADSDVQWALASQPSAYAKQGVTQYQRLIAQAQQDDGTLAYWLDIGRVAGGKMRDDSFHSRMTQASFNMQLPPSDPSRPALFGDKNLAALIQPDLRLKGFDKKSFYWTPPGNGYGFLGNPRQAAMPQTVRGVFTRPATRKGEDKIAATVMVVDFAGGPGRQFIVADGPGAGILPAVPYVLCRDDGAGTSTFAKLIRLADTTAADPIASFEALHVQPAGVADNSHAAPSAWCVTWKNGRRDIWIVADPARDGRVKVTGQGFPPISTDGRVTLIRLDKGNNILRVVASEASAVETGDGYPVKGVPALRGKITAIDPSASPACFAVDWDKKSVTATLSRGSLLRVESKAGQNSSWNFSYLRNDQNVELEQVKPWIGATRLEPVSGQAGWYRMVTPISQFDAPGGKRNVAYAVGRRVYDGASPAGRIVELSEDGQTMKLAAMEGALPSKAFDATIMLAAPGDEVVIPLELDARAK